MYVESQSIKIKKLPQKDKYNSLKMPPILNRNSSEDMKEGGDDDLPNT